MATRESAGLTLNESVDSFQEQDKETIYTEDSGAESGFGHF